MTKRREYESDGGGLGPLFESSVSALTPQSCVTDPPSAKIAAQSEGARRLVVKGTARFLLLLHRAPDGLTDYEAVDALRQAYPEMVDQLGVIGFVLMAKRNWCLCKPNDDIRNKKHENLELITQTEKTRINPRTGRPNVVFQFITPPTPSDLAEWERLANEE